MSSLGISSYTEITSFGKSLWKRDPSEIIYHKVTVSSMFCELHLLLILYRVYKLIQLCLYKFFMGVQVVGLRVREMRIMITALASQSVCT